jgi:hypothetical protein
MTIAEAISAIDDMEQDNKEQLAQHGIAVLHCEMVELSLPLPNGEKAVRYAQLNEEGIRIAYNELRKEYPDAEIGIYAEWRECMGYISDEGDDAMSGDKVGDEFFAVLDGN